MDPRTARLERRHGLALLSTGEREQIMALIAKGTSRREIAAIIGITKRQLDYQISNHGLHEAVSTIAAAKLRPCMTCRTEIVSEGAHHRMCDGCRAGAAAMDHGIDAYLVGARFV